MILCGRSSYGEYSESVFLILRLRSCLKYLASFVVKFWVFQRVSIICKCAT